MLQRRNGAVASLTGRIEEPQQQALNQMAIEELETKLHHRSELQHQLQDRQAGMKSNIATGPHTAHDTLEPRVHRVNQVHETGYTQRKEWSTMLGL